ncbi:MAG: hypothetical protein ACREDX_11690 [Aestuariivirga sp.]
MVLARDTNALLGGPAVVAVAEKDIAPLIAARRDVVKRAGKFD